MRGFRLSVGIVAWGCCTPDVYSVITTADERTVQVLGDALELRATDSQQQQMLADYLARISFPSADQALDRAAHFLTQHLTAP